jgi:hypothetical protein
VARQRKEVVASQERSDGNLRREVTKLRSYAPDLADRVAGDEMALEEARAILADR